jgi:hypothetical protein
VPKSSDGFAVSKLWLNRDCLLSGVAAICAMGLAIRLIRLCLTQKTKPGQGIPIISDQFAEVDREEGLAVNKF